jgi:methylated-DNA-[protein]-cysteine S-methyltransferase
LEHVDADGRDRGQGDEEGHEDGGGNEDPGEDIMTTMNAIHANCTAQATITTPLGRITLARTATGLAGAWFEGQKHHPGAIEAPERPDDALLQRAAGELTEFFAGQREHFDVPLDLQGTSFQRSVWQQLLRITAGTTRTYGEIAKALGSARAVRAVGGAVGRNPLSVIVPCHRVVGSDGSLTGYAGGVDRKRALLQLEGAAR